VNDAGGAAVINNEQDRTSVILTLTFLFNIPHMVYILILQLLLLLLFLSEYGRSRITSVSIRDIDQRSLSVCLLPH
jgi:hypothetical protein